MPSSLPSKLSLTPSFLSPSPTSLQPPTKPNKNTTTLDNTTSLSSDPSTPTSSRPTLINSNKNDSSRPLCERINTEFSQLETVRTSAEKEQRALQAKLDASDKRSNERSREWKREEVREGGEGEGWLSSEFGEVEESCGGGEGGEEEVGGGVGEEDEEDKDEGEDPLQKLMAMLEVRERVPHELEVCRLLFSLVYAFRFDLEGTGGTSKAASSPRYPFLLLLSFVVALP